MKRIALSYRKDGAGDGTQTRDVQLGNLPSDWKYRTYASKALNPDYLEPWKINYLRFALGLTQ